MVNDSVPNCQIKIDGFNIPFRFDQSKILSLYQSDGAFQRTFSCILGVLITHATWILIMSTCMSDLLFVFAFYISQNSGTF